jgi:hypothetical protein
MRRHLPLLMTAIILAAAGCGAAKTTATPALTASSVPATPTPTVPASPEPTPTSTPTASPIPDNTVWLCRPGLTANPCEGDLSATSIDASGTATPQPAAPAADPPIDCFYVYPTVSRQKTVNADLTIDEEQRGVAIAQAALFSKVCRVYAPMYPQLTLEAISNPSRIKYADAMTAYTSVADSFRNYMANYNHGRGIVFIGHSQGSMMLMALLKFQVDGDAALRRQLVSALLIGGNVTVPVGKLVGGDFSNIPACTSTSQTGCVVAYSSYDRTPPADAPFARVTATFNFFNRSSAVPQQVLCVNPASPGGGTATLKPYIPTAGLEYLLGRAAPVLSPFTPFITYPNLYRAHCANSGGASWLQIDRIGGAADKRPAAKAGSASWGLHTLDVTLALGNLVDLVGAQSAAFV